MHEAKFADSGLTELKLLALDSSHWINLTKSAYRGNKSVRREAESFVDLLLQSGFSVLFTLHHLQELVAIKDRFLVAERIRFLENIPFLTWISFGDPLRPLGGVTDILAAEALAAYETGGDVGTVRKTVKSQIVQCGSGNELIPDDPYYRDFLQDWAQARNDHARTITGIAPINFHSDKKTLGQLMSGRLRSPEEAEQAWNQIFASITNELVTKGDRRIADPANRASAFVRECIELRNSLANDAKTLVLEGLRLQGVEEHEVHPDMTMNEVNELVLFRNQLRTVAPMTGIPFDELKQYVRMDQLPSRVIKRCLDGAAQELSERKGSDLNDGYLATLAAYADVLYVDKRTAENFRRALHRNDDLKQLVGDIKKAGDWREIRNQI